MSRTVWSRVGQPISLPCGVQLTDSSDYALEWRKETNLIFNAFGNETGHASLALQGRIARKDLSLTIHSVCLDDQGSYACSVVSFGRSGKNVAQNGLNVHLVVRAPPTILYPAANDTVLFASIDQKFEVDCEAEGIPAPEIKWIKKNTTKSEAKSEATSETKSLSIESVNANDEGQFECIARNDEGTNRVLIQLRLYKSPQLDYELSNKTVVEGGSVLWKCSAHAQPDNVSYHWTTQNKSSINTLELGLRAHVQDGDFGITNVNRLDEGWFVCEASNGHLPNAKTQAYLTVQYKPEMKSSTINRQILVFGEGTSASLNCQMDANPPVSQTFWSKNGLVLVNDRPNNSSNNFVYSFSNVSSSDAGMFACWAENVVGRSAVYEFHVIVASALQFSREPPPESTIDVGESLAVECNGFGDPSPTQFWMRETKKISGSVLRIRNASYADSGLYQCVLTNSIVSNSRNFTLNVRNTRPHCIQDSHMECAGESGFELTFKKGYDGGHSQHFRLFYKKVESEATLFDKWDTTREFDDDSLRLDGLDRFAKYQFYLETRNILGATNCTLKDQYTCSVLNSPQNLHVYGNDKLEWSEVDEANGYRVLYQTEDRPFELFAEVTDPEVNIERLLNKDAINFYVQATRPPFQPSRPSQIYTFEYQNESGSPTLAYTSLFIVAFGLFLTFIYFVFGKKCKAKRKKKSAVAGQYIHQNGINMMETTKEDLDALWVARTEPDATEMDDEDLSCGFGAPYQTPHVVNEMLKHKYIYSLADDTLERIRESLHIEKLRNELRQSVL